MVANPNSPFNPQTTREGDLLRANTELVEAKRALQRRINAKDIALEQMIYLIQNSPVLEPGFVITYLRGVIATE